MKEYILKLKVITILVTVIFTSLIWLIPFTRLSNTIVTLREDIDNVADKETVAIARKIKNSDYSYEEYIVGYEDQIEVLETSLWGKDSRIESLERQVEVIQQSYERKLEKSELIKYHLESSVLSEEQLRVADEIAHTVASNYEEYGVLPSVAVGQAMQESQLGKVCPSNNLWGISTGNYTPFSSLDEGIFTYLKCINNGYYDGALFERNYTTAMYHIQSGGYCQPSDGYASAVISCIEKYGFAEYDDYYLGSAENEQSNETRNGEAEQN